MDFISTPSHESTDMPVLMNITGILSVGSVVTTHTNAELGYRTEHFNWDALYRIHLFKEIIEKLFLYHLVSGVYVYYTIKLFSLQ